MNAKGLREHCPLSNYSGLATITNPHLEVEAVSNGQKQIYTREGQSSHECGQPGLARPLTLCSILSGHPVAMTLPSSHPCFSTVCYLLPLWEGD
jgi:hypothetical protein